MPYMISAMDSKKMFLLPVVISLVGHVALLAVSSLVDLRENVKAAEIFTVRIAQSEPAAPPPKEEKKVQEQNQKPPQPQKEQSVQPPPGSREDTVDLGSSDVKYADYLAGLKKKILHRWVTSDVYRNNEEGTVVILMSLDANGSLIQVTTTTSSGIPDMDQGTLGVIRKAAPFRPLPRQYDLSRLHITASFRYGADR